MAASRLIAGAMSGTSADGVDVALVKIAGRGLGMSARPIVHTYEPFTPELRRQVLEVRQQGGCRFADLAEIGRQVTLAYARCFKTALAKANVSADQVEAIAAHGQTLFHAPPNTIQYFDPSLLAYETGVQVVSDFRRADLAAGGQGAPLVPFADWILFRHPTKSRVILNIGGIANLTYLKAGGSIDEVIAFDTGPGNCLSDWLMREQGGVDENGALAQQGACCEAIAKAFLVDLFFRKPTPKSTDGPEMVRAFDAVLSASAIKLPQADLLATAAEVVAQSIADAIQRRRPIDDVLVAGGGLRNQAIMERLARQLSQRGITAEIRAAGVDVDSQTVDFASAREAIAFALLGAATLDGEPSNVPSATGASRRVVLGSITPRPSSVA